MKRLVAALLLLASPSFAMDTNRVQKSSYVAVNQTAYLAASFLDKVIVGATSAGGVLEIYNSTFTTTGTLVASITLGTINYIDFQDLQVKGVYYKTSTATNGVTILFKS
jgi:hypothetical protein